MAGMRPKQRRLGAPKRVHPTKKKLLDVAVKLMADLPLAEITTDLVLETSGISRGSLYHHFEDLSDLLESAAVSIFAARVDANIEMMRDFVTHTGSAAEFLDKLFLLNEDAQAAQAAPSRLFRMRLIALAGENPRLAKKLAVEQDRLTDAFEALISQSQQRGYFRDDVDPRAAAVLMQAYTLGRAVDDVSSHPVAPDVWTQMIKQLILRFIWNGDAATA